MFKWLTRNDGRLRAKAWRRLGSPRGSVFTEFALVMPIAVLVCSALIEIAGLWDAQVMANHSAWTVGRIAMVRGTDGLVFSKDFDKKTDTGADMSEMPSSLALLVMLFPEVKQFNNRGNIATLFLMSTCGIGYYGSSPGGALAEMFNGLCNAAVTALTKSIPEWIVSAVTDISLPGFDGGSETGIAGFVNQLVKGIVDKVVQYALKPIAEGLQSLLSKAFDKIMGKDGIKIENLFNGKGAASRFARQVYGAAARIAKAKATTGKEVLTVESMDSLNGPYMFAKRSKLGRLVYPQVVDREAKSDGYFVTGAHGWPANDNGLAMIHVEINWPYESGWLFPIVSGRASASSSKPVVATGHSMVFPQPNIRNEHLYSEGATAFEPGSYTNNAGVAQLDDLAEEMKNYLKSVKFCMKYRLCEDTVSLGDEGSSWKSYTWKRCKELKSLWGLGDGKQEGNYGKCWQRLTDGKDQDDLLKNLEGYFKASSYRSKDYFYWDDDFRDNKYNDIYYHKRYGLSLCDAHGNAGLGAFCDMNAGLCYRSHDENKYPSASAVAEKVAFNLIFKKKKAEIDAAIQGGVKADWLYNQLVDFAKRNKVNVYNLVKWQEGHDLEAWKRQDREVHETAMKAEKSFAAITKLLHDEITDIENMENGTSSWTGDEDDPVFDPNDEEVMKDPDAAARKAREKWAALKATLRKKLLEVDAAAVELRNEWQTYKNAVSQFESDRANCVGNYFVEACINTLIQTKDKTVFDVAKDSSFRIPAGCMPYDIGKGTRDMLDRVKAYYDKLDKSYKLEVEYGAMMGLESAGKAKREGKSPDEVVDQADAVEDDKGGSLAPGSDTGAIIDRDRQKLSGGSWQWY